MVSRMETIKPLREYLEDKKEMIEQMFSCIEDHQLKKMIPDVLKDTNLEDLKAECLVELLGMSKKRIIGILDGKELDESSEDSLELSDITDDELPVKTVKKERKSPEKNKKKNAKSSKVSKKSKSKLSSESEDIEELDESSDERDPSPPSKKKKTKKKDDTTSKEILVKKNTKLTKKKKTADESDAEESEKLPDIEIDLGVEVPPPEKTGGKNLLEILELEMRARAIRSLIEREEKKKDDGPETEQVPPTNEKKTLPEPEEDDDPEAVIVIDERIGEEIDLTKDDSDSESKKDNNENPAETLEKNNSESEENRPIIDTVSEKQVKEKQVPNYRKHHNQQDDDDDIIICDNTEDKNQPKDADTNVQEFIPKSWTERWLESDDVQKVMKTSKVLTNLKKRMITVNKQKSLDGKETEEVQENVSIEGTVSEYTLLPTIKVYNSEETNTEDNPPTEEIIPQQPVIISAKPVLYTDKNSENNDQNDSHTVENITDNVNTFSDSGENSNYVNEGKNDDTQNTENNVEDKGINEPNNESSVELIHEHNEESKSFSEHSNIIKISIGNLNEENINQIPDTSENIIENKELTTTSQTEVNKNSKENNNSKDKE